MANALSGNFTLQAGPLPSGRRNNQNTGARAQQAQRTQDFSAALSQANTPGSVMTSLPIPGAGNANLPAFNKDPSHETRTQALATLSRMLENNSGADSIGNFRNNLSQSALTDLTSLTQEAAFTQGNNKEAIFSSHGIDPTPRARYNSNFKLDPRVTVPGTAGTAGAVGQNASKPVSALTARPNSVSRPEKVEGSLSAQYESGKDGVAAIGYDRVGGTSYGKYQIASATGSMDQFITFLEKRAPDVAKSLKGAGNANTGSKSGQMPETWVKIAQKDPARFEKLQDEFIMKSHYEPALNQVRERTGIDTSQLSQPMKEVLWSTAVQHGAAGAARIFSRAVENVSATVTSVAEIAKGNKQFDPKQQSSLITEVYALRSKQFGSSTNRVQKAVANRLQNEMQAALGMVKQTKTTTA